MSLPQAPTGSTPLPVSRADAIAMGFGPQWEAMMAASAIMQDNLDILEWIVCVLDEWSVHAPRSDVPHPFNTGRIRPCIVDFVRDGFPIYAYQGRRFWNTEPSVPRCDYWGATGAATGQNQQPFTDDGGRPGVVLPVFYPNYWVYYGLAIEAGGSTGLCAAIGIAKVLIHELMHLCVAGEDDAFQCWALQNMAATTFFVLMEERYPCIKNNWCCNAPVATVMSSEPGPYAFGGDPLRIERWLSEPGACVGSGRFVLE
ncbi:MAG: hypothetical protein H6736_04780 [Alphaproteobacteria bacterium]|nr:hypothetical protein [Alphaproteobacteria bacterium]MCB9691112.1 hypothetical protein [Alphaproteobacteria bacterium]